MAGAWEDTLAHNTWLGTVYDFSRDNLAGEANTKNNADNARINADAEL